MTPATMFLHQHKAPKEVKQLFDEIDGREERIELNLYVVGYENEAERDAAQEREAPPEPTPSESESS